MIFNKDKVPKARINNCVPTTLLPWQKVQIQKKGILRRVLLLEKPQYISDNVLDSEHCV